MWTNSGYQLSQIARVKPTYSLTSVSTGVPTLLVLNPRHPTPPPSFSVSKPLRYSFYPLPISRSSFSNYFSTNGSVVPSESEVPSPTEFDVSVSVSFFLLATTPRQPPTRTIPSRPFFVVGRPASFPGTELPPDFWLLLSPASCSVTKSIRCFVEFSRPPLLLLDVGQVVVVVVVVFGG